ncbi:HET-domain-containing protein [Epithele typhae]|uniref:HET-domain-containing protein n=1 Tax=Epithele typhae TaxID=378194 RepID=UPI002007620F|nr:HET-domain-containing protein [Epithele typhae]KAH9935213.1 HET-domain-containing protein [Epithele typhae]
MWLLSTSRADLHFFSDPSSVPEGYAILSHTWSQVPGLPEQSFQDTQAIIVRCNAEGSNPRDFVSPKIRECCVVAERDGYLWVWIDTCCINKESSTELSEAINSMFSWYVMSEVCYAYLDDVGSDDDLYSRHSQFRRSRWHTRGWTLQELLGPAFLVFMSKIGSRWGQDTNLLTAWQESPGFAKPQGDAGGGRGVLPPWVFNINMPTLYGEGRQAFYRLQVELSRQSSDTTLFAWGISHRSNHDNLPKESLKKIWAGLHGTTHHSRFLFAPSPSSFMKSDVYWTPGLSTNGVLQPYLASQWTTNDESVIGAHRKKTGPFGRIKLPTFKLTSQGMKCHFPVAEFAGITIMVLLAQTDDQHLGIILHPAESDEIQNPSQPLFYVTWAFKKDDSAYNIFRLVELGGDLYNLTFRGFPIDATWRDLYIHAGPRIQDRIDPAHLIIRLLPDRFPAPFRIPRWLVGSLASRQFVPSTSISKTDLGAAFEMRLKFSYLSERIWVKLGTCVHIPSDVGVVHWAWAISEDLRAPGAPWDRAHDCATEHVDDWGGAPPEGDTQSEQSAPPYEAHVNLVRAQWATYADNASSSESPPPLARHRHQRQLSTAGLVGFPSQISVPSAASPEPISPSQSPSFPVSQTEWRPTKDESTAMRRLAKRFGSLLGSRPKRRESNTSRGDSKTNGTGTGKGKSVDG